jgi:RND family efflux transporter MFP subunit
MLSKSMRGARGISKWIGGLPRMYSIIGGIILIVAVVLGIHLATRAAPTPSTPAAVAHVKLSSVASLSNETGPLPVTGKVTSKSQATILAQSAGEVVSLSHALGDHVSAGEVIASLDSTSQQAAVLQAEGAFDAATAALAKATGSTAANSGISGATAAQAAATARTALATSLLSTYASLDDAIHTKADTMFTNPRSSSPHLIQFTIPDYQLVTTIETERLNVETALTNAQALASTTTSTDVSANVDQMLKDATTIGTFLNDLIQAVNKAVPNQSVDASAISGYRTSLAAARTELVGAVSGLTAAKGAYDSAISGAATAANTSSSGLSNDIAAAEANLKSAQGALNSAKANLEKTNIRSPISGTIVTLTITKGDFVSSFAQVAEVSNPSALEIDTYVTPDDAKTLSIGGEATIENDTKGVIVSIAPALDPTTGKIQVKLGITGSQSALTDGDTVSVSLARGSGAGASKPSKSSPIVIPIVSTKITPDGPIVFTVASSTLIANKITLGTILGDKVTVISGLTEETDIVTDARGLSNGQTIVVDQN